MELIRVSLSLVRPLLIFPVLFHAEDDNGRRRYGDEQTDKAKKIAKYKKREDHQNRWHSNARSNNSWSDNIDFEKMQSGNNKDAARNHGKIQFHREKDHKLHTEHAEDHAGNWNEIGNGENNAQ